MQKKTTMIDNEHKNNIDSVIREASCIQEVFRIQKESKVTKILTMLHMSDITNVKETTSISLSLFYSWYILLQLIAVQ